MNQQNITADAQTNQVRCSGCGAGMVYDIATGGLKCNHCGTTRAFEDTDRVQRRALTQDILKTHPDWNAVVFACSNCGAKEVLDRKNIARKCAFCGSAQIIETKELPGIQPDSVIPFTITEQAAAERFRKWIGAKFFAPKVIRKGKVDEHMNRVYTPCWSFSAEVMGDYNGTLGRTVSNGKTTSIRWFRVNGRIGGNYDDHFIQSGDRITNINFNRIRPFNLKEIRVYRSEYLAGIVAEHYSRNIESCLNDFTQFVQRDLTNRIMRQHGAQHVSTLSINKNYNNKRFNYVLLPLYISNYQYNKKLYNFYVNGQSGKVVGRYPKSKGKILLTVLGIGLVVVGVAVGLYFAGVFPGVTLGPQ